MIDLGTKRLNKGLLCNSPDSNSSSIPMSAANASIVARQPHAPMPFVGM
jgi:hypothetical protein